jgi:hypothetical protein
VKGLNDGIPTLLPWLLIEVGEKVTISTASVSGSSLESSIQAIKFLSILEWFAIADHNLFLSETPCATPVLYPCNRETRALQGNCEALPSIHI